MNTSKILCCGLLVADLKFRIESFPNRDEKIFAQDFSFIPGGPATNAALTISQLGGDVDLLASTGTCPVSDSLIQILKIAGLKATFIAQSENCLTTSAILTEANGERRVVSYKNIKDVEIPDNTPVPKIILIDGHQKEASLKLLEKYPQATSILDAGSVHPGTDALFNKVDWLVCSKKFAISKTNKENLNQALENLAKDNSNVVITNGEHGCLYSINGKSEVIDGIPVKSIDSNGAGDVFHGAFAHALASDLLPLEALEFANKVAAKSCQYEGIIGAIFNV
ncbi:MAG: PfkB family carbohydrate kinase [Lentisphaeraceae bacterium]|nr:PfkB family carbohydrate kinase [Lentisphaeraceae bacterium]